MDVFAKKKKLAVIFDMDGVVANSMPYHIRAWTAFAKKRGINLTREYIRRNLSGRINREIIKRILRKRFDSTTLFGQIAEKESLYRKLYQPFLKPVKGLPAFLKILRRRKIQVALATAAPPANVEFVLGRLGLKNFFSVVVNSAQVRLGKPHPEIFLNAARKLKAKPENCIVFEDSLLGIKAAKSAGMKVVGVATSHQPKELARTDLVIKDFTEVNASQLENL